jgi:acyl carrier protein
MVKLSWIYAQPSANFITTKKTYYLKIFYLLLVLKKMVMSLYMILHVRNYITITEEKMTKLYEIISKIMDIPTSELSDNSGPENVETWDSFNGLLLADELETQFKIKFTNEEIIDVKNIADIKRHLQNHGILLDD